MSIELKIKSKHLSLEPAIIKHEERKLLNEMKWFKQKHQISNKTPYYQIDGLYHTNLKYSSLCNHRKFAVCDESRATFLARAYIAGKSYKSVEKICKDEKKLKEIVFPRIVNMVLKYGSTKIRKVWNKEKQRQEYPEDKLQEFKNTILQWLGFEI